MSRFWRIRTANTVTVTVAAAPTCSALPGTGRTGTQSTGTSPRAGDNAQLLGDPALMPLGTLIDQSAATTRRAADTTHLVEAADQTAGQGRAAGSIGSPGEGIDHVLAGLAAVGGTP